MRHASDPTSPSRLANSIVRPLIVVNAGAAFALLGALLVAGVWQDAAMDFVPYIAVSLALHGCGVLAGVSVQGLRYLRARALRPGAPRAFGYLAAVACALSGACFAAGLGVVVWGGLTALPDAGGDDASRSAVQIRAQFHPVGLR